MMPFASLLAALDEIPDPRRPQGGCVRSPRHDPPHAAQSRPKSLITNPNFPERL